MVRGFWHRSEIETGQCYTCISVDSLIVLCRIIIASLHYSPSSRTGSPPMWSLLLQCSKINHLRSILSPLRPLSVFSFLSGYCHGWVNLGKLSKKKPRLKHKADKTCHVDATLFPSMWLKKHCHIHISLSVLSVRMLSWLSEQLWADWIWFPEGHGWADLKDHDGKVFPKPKDLWATIPMALCFLVIRQIFERWVPSNSGSLNPMNGNLPLCLICIFLSDKYKVVFKQCFPFSRTVAIPLASLLGVRDKKRVCAPPNPLLEDYFCRTSKHPTQVIILHTLGD